MNPCPVFPVIGTVTAIGPSTLDNGALLCRYIEISEQDGKGRRLATQAYVQQRGGRDVR